MKTTILIVVIVSALILIFTAVILIKKYFIKAVEKSIGAYQNDLVEKHFEEVENMYRQTRGWRHDYRNHIQTMKAYLAMNEIEKLESYLDELDADLTTVDTVIKTGNVMIDAILNSKISLAKSKNINVNAKAIVPKHLNMSEVDLSIIIGNLMDNAIEACGKSEVQENRFIRVYIDILKGQLYIYVMNSVNEELKRKGKTYISTKNSRNHGFGLMRMDKVVERHNGYIDRQDEEGVFATEVMLPL